MSTPYIGEIRMGGWNFAPLDWALCEGQLLPISEYSALFELIGTTYGGDGVNTFGLPDLRGRMPIHQGNNGQITVVMGQLAGEEAVTLTANQIPSHTHTLHAQSTQGTSPSPSGGVPAASVLEQYSTVAGSNGLANGSLTQAGGSQPHENMPPYVALTFVISLFGVFPSQS